VILARPRGRHPGVAGSILPQNGPEGGALKLGKALAPLREQGVVMLASGALTHGLQDFNPRAPDAPLPHVSAFTDWTAERIAEADLEALRDYRSRAPGAVRNHPEEEHLLPLFVAIGAGGLAGARRLHASYTHAILAMDVYSFG
jgi:4,5-DOPA dioxygenase extradiol